MYTAHQIDRLITNALEGSDGHTEYTFDDPSGSYRYVVGGIDTISLPVSAMNAHPRRMARMIRQWSDDNRDAETLGFWVDGGRMYFDGGETFAFRDQALSIARQRGELAIWDRVAECEIRVV